MAGYVHRELGFGEDGAGVTAGSRTEVGAARVGGDLVLGT